MQKDIENYLQYIHAEGKSPCTITAYASDLAQFQGFVGQFFSGEVRAEEVSLLMIRDWLRWLHEKPVGNRSLARKTAALNSFFHFLKITGSIPKTPWTR